MFALYFTFPRLYFTYHTVLIKEVSQMTPLNTNTVLHGIPEIKQCMQSRNLSWMLTDLFSKSLSSILPCMRQQTVLVVCARLCLMVSKYSRKTHYSKYLILSTMGVWHYKAQTSWASHRNHLFANCRLDNWYYDDWFVQGITQFTNVTLNDNTRCETFQILCLNILWLWIKFTFRNKFLYRTSRWEVEPGSMLPNIIL